MPPIIQAKPVMYTVKDSLHTLSVHPNGERTPFTDRKVHFVGIGGSGMSGLAQMLLNFGASVSGTDRAASPVTRKLSEIGAAVSYQENAGSLPAGTEIVVHSAAVKLDHPELVAA